MGVRRGESRWERGEGKEGDVKTHHMLLHVSPCEENSSITASDITPHVI